MTTPGQSHTSASATESEWHSAVHSALDKHRSTPGALIPVLHDIQNSLGYIPQDAVPEIASALNLSRAEVHGVFTFYHDFRSEPAGRHTVRVCRAESCKAVGADALIAHLKGRLGADLHSTTADGNFTVEPVYCLGNCALSPAVTVDGVMHGRVTTQSLDKLIDRALKESNGGDE